MAYNYLHCKSYSYTTVIIVLILTIFFERDMRSFIVRELEKKAEITESFESFVCTRFILDWKENGLTLSNKCIKK